MNKLPRSEEIREEYSFAGMRFFPNDWLIEIAPEEPPISLSRTQREVLLTLLRNAELLVSYEDLRKAVWPHEPEVDSRVIHNIHVTKSKLTALFDARGVDSSFIETIDGEGYKLNTKVQYLPPVHENSETGIDRISSLIPAETDDLHPVIDSEETRDFRPKKPRYMAPLIPIVLSLLLIGAIIILTRPGIFFGPDGGPTPGPGTSILLKETNMVTRPIHGVEFYLRIEAENIDPESVRMKVTGPGCGGDKPCSVSNGDLRLYGQITQSVIEKAPLTLAKGDFQIWLENGSGNPSNKLNITVNAADAR